MSGCRSVRGDLESEASMVAQKMERGVMEKEKSSHFVYIKLVRRSLALATWYNPFSFLFQMQSGQKSNPVVY